MTFYSKMGILLAKVQEMNVTKTIIIKEDNVVNKSTLDEITDKLVNLLNKFWGCFALSLQELQSRKNGHSRQ